MRSFSVIMVTMLYIFVLLAYVAVDFGSEKPWPPWVSDVLLMVASAIVIGNAVYFATRELRPIAPADYMLTSRKRAQRYAWGIAAAAFLVLVCAAVRMILVDALGHDHWLDAARIAQGSAAGLVVIAMLVVIVVGPVPEHEEEILERARTPSDLWYRSTDVLLHGGVDPFALPPGADHGGHVGGV